MKSPLTKGAVAMYEKPLERLNYFNGQRLEAADLKTEQDYHIRTRRWLNKSLYSAGIGRGLEVKAIPPDPVTQAPHCVGVSCGLAIDDDGREIILLEEALIEVCSYSGTGESTVVGNYLVIEYAEETQAFEKNGGCGVRETGARTSTSTTNFGGPSRVQAKPKFSWIPFPPQPGSNQIVLARVELGSDCDTVHQIDTGIRRYIGAASAAKVRQYALEGERHIDPKNPARIYFHIRGRQPNSVTLYLRAEQFSTLYYTELGRHDHTITVDVNSVTIPAHSHTLTPIAGYTGTGPAGGHTPSYSDIRASATEVTQLPSGFSFVLTNFGNVPIAPGSIVFPGPVGPKSLQAWAGMSVTFDPVLDHSHSIPISTDPDPAKPIFLSGGGSSRNAGVSDAPARSDDPNKPEKALTYVDDLQVLIGEDVSRLKNKTKDILDQLRDAQAGATWDQLGDGKDSHVLAKDGTGAIRLDFLPGVTFSDGKEYVIDLRVASGGGRILYNLYIE